MERVDEVTVAIEFRCPDDVRRMFGKAETGGSGVVQYRCRDCRNRRMAQDPEWRGQVVHAYDVATGVCVQTQVLTATVRRR